MGSYAYTCALSELPIEAGDAILIVPLAHTQRGLNEGSESQYSLAFPPARASYNDYGFAEDIATTPFHDAYAAKLGHKDALAFFDALQTRKASVEWRSETLTLEFALVRQDAWDAMLSLPVEWSSDSDRGQLALSMATAGASQGAGILAKAGQLLSTPDWQAMLAKVDGEHYTKPRLAAALLNGPLADDIEQMDAFSSMYARRMGFSHGPSDFFLGAHTTEILCIDMPATSTQPELEAALLLCGHTVAVGVAMRMVRKIWEPRDSSGPQFGEWPMHFLWTRKLTALADASVEWNEDCHWQHGFSHAKSERERDQIEQASSPAPRRGPAPSI